jgi:hypothetical protein
MLVIAIVGFPGCGKTTVAEMASQELEIPHIEISKLVKESGFQLKKDWWLLRNQLHRDLWILDSNFAIVSGIRDLRIATLLPEIDIHFIYLQLGIRDRMKNYRRGLWAFIKGELRTRILLWPYTFFDLDPLEVIPYQHNEQSLRDTVSYIERRISQ